MTILAQKESMATMTNLGSIPASLLIADGGGGGGLQLITVLHRGGPANNFGVP